MDIGGKVSSDGGSQMYELRGMSNPHIGYQPMIASQVAGSAGTHGTDNRVVGILFVQLQMYFILAYFICNIYNGTHYQMLKPLI